ncbi:MAG: hypothetical protein ABJF01_20430 [bacterium]
MLTDLADAVLRGAPPAAFPALGTIVLFDASGTTAAYQRLTRIARQLKLIHDAVARWMSPGTETTVRAKD